jgi:GT2 family glycosyltransferase
VEWTGTVTTPPVGTALPGNRWDLLAGVRPDVPPKVSIVVAHYRQPQQLARTLAALRRQDHASHRLEVIVADDGSPEPPRVPDDVVLVRQEDAGFRLAAARNLGAAAATGEILVFLDADTTPEPAFVRELVRLPALAPDCVTVGRRRHARLDDVPVTEDIELAVAGRELVEPPWLREAYRTSRNLLDADDRSYRYVIGAALACSRRLFDESGGFDDTFTSYGGEDWEWAYRAWIGGALLAHVPTAIAWHDGPDASERPATGRSAKNAEAIRLSGLIPVPGSCGRGLRSAKVDMAVSGPPAPATPADVFVSVDSVLAAIPGAEAIEADTGTHDLLRRGRFDRVRVHLDILRPVLVVGGALAAQVARMGREHLGELLIVDDAGTELIRISSMRARARHLRWARDDLFSRERSTCDGVHALANEVDVEAYLGGWTRG